MEFYLYFILKDVFVSALCVQVFACVYVRTPCVCSAYGDQKRAEDCPKLELQVVVMGDGN